MKKPFNISGSVLSLGEILLRMIPDADGEWLRKRELPFSLGGAELNVATNLALWNLKTKYFTAMPDNGLTEQILRFLETRGLDISSVFLGGDRLGLFYLTQGKDMKHDALIYDRALSSFSELKTGIIDWAKVLEGVSWLHISAISPGISQRAAYLCEEALIEASKMNITISMDMNYRAKLWQYGKAPEKILPRLLAHCHLVMGNIWALEKMAGLKSAPRIPNSGHKKDYEEICLMYSERMVEEFPNCRTVANTFRFEEGSHIRYFASLFEEDKMFYSQEYQSDNFEDKVGSGDCFMAGLIYGYYQNLDSPLVLDFATAAAFDKLFIKGDSTTSLPEDIQKRIKWK
jgi:2-dehydro-3-deoxygluconokinase